MSRQIRLGPAAILLTVVSICLAVLGTLTITTAYADLRTARQYARSVQDTADRERAGQEFLAQAHAALAAGEELSSLEGVETDETGHYEKTISTGNSRLEILLEVEDGQLRILKWQTDANWTAPDDWENLWDGK